MLILSSRATTVVFGVAARIWYAVRIYGNLEVCEKNRNSLLWGNAFRVKKIKEYKIGREKMGSSQIAEFT